jgi:hypothetical protein
VAQTSRANPHQYLTGARSFGLDRFNTQFLARSGQNGGTETQRHWEIASRVRDLASPPGISTTAAADPIWDNEIGVFMETAAPDGIASTSPYGRLRTAYLLPRPGRYAKPRCACA